MLSLCTRNRMNVVFVFVFFAVVVAAVTFGSVTEANTAKSMMVDPSATITVNDTTDAITHGKAAPSQLLLAYVVNSNGDTNAVNLVTGTDAGGNITLRSAIQAANTQPGSHTITFSGSLVSPINLTLGQIAVGNAALGNNITITGPGMNSLTVNQTTENRIFSTGTGAVTFLLQDITLNYAGPAVTPYSGGGGAIIAGGAGAATTLINCRISNFQRQIGNGGAVSASSSLNNHSLTITNSIFTNNRAGGGGGAVSFNSQGGTATITGSIFDNNHTGPVGANTGGDGGAINLSGGGSGGTYLVERNTFLNNQAENPGGHAGAIMSTNGTATIRYNRFIGNTCLNTTIPPLANVIAQAGGATIHVTIANDNWWGVNTGPGINDATFLGGGAGSLTATQWLQLRNTPATTPIVTGQTTTVSADILGRNSGGPISAANLVGLLTFPAASSTIFSLPVRGNLSATNGQFVNGIANLTPTFTASSAGAGSTSATADNQTIAGAITINKANTTAAITNNPATTVVGQGYTVNFSMAVTAPGSASPTAPTGNVQVSDGTQTCTGAINAAGTGSCILTSTSAGNKTITATYQGDINFNASAASAGVAHTVNKADTTVAVGTTGTPSVFGQSVTLTATITVTSPGAGSPTGNVTFKDNNLNIGTCTAQTVAASVATCAISTLSVATHPITAVYNGDANFNLSPASPILNQVVNKANTTIGITSSQNPSLTGQPVTFTATVAVTAPGAGTPTGTVNFLDGGVSITGCSAVALTGLTAQCMTSALAAASHTITAAYGGDGSFNASPTGNMTGNPQVVSNTAVWDGSASGDWNTAANWTTNFVPLATHSISLPAAGVTNQPNLSAQDTTVVDLAVGANRTLTIGGSRTLTVTGVLTMNGLNIDATAGLLEIGGAGSVTRTSGVVLGAIRKVVTSAPIASEASVAPESPAFVFVYPVGTSTGFSPLSANFTAGSGSLTVSAINGTAPSTPGLIDATTLDRYWQMSGTGSITASLTFSYLDPDVDGIEANYRLIRTAAGSPPVRFPNGCPASPCVDAAANTISVANVQSFNNFWTAGEPVAPTAANVEVAGRVFDSSGRAVVYAIVVMTDSNGNTRQSLTNAFGYYRFTEVESGRDYVFNVASKGRTFQPRVVTVNDSVADMDFIASP